MGRGPQHSGRVVQIAVALNAHAQTAMLAVGQCRAHRCRRLVADARSALRADVVVMLAEVPQARGPGTDEAVVRNQRPIVVLDLRPQFRREPRRADGAGVPGQRRQFTIAFAVPLVRLGDLAVRALRWLAGGPA